MNFKKNNVNPGEPVTAQAWNDIVDTLFEVQTILSAEARRVRVKVSRPTPGFDLSRVRVVAVQDGFAVAEAVPPIDPGDEHVFATLKEGAYTLSATAPGFAVTSAPLTITHGVEPPVVAVALTASLTPMPNVLGLKLPAATSALGALRPTLLDVGGKTLPFTGFDVSYNDSLVLAQWPDAGEPASTTGGFLLVSVKQTKFVTMPDLVGKSVSEAKALLKTLNLTLEIVD
jgi:hypothetical protein